MLSLFCKHPVNKMLRCDGGGNVYFSFWLCNGCGKQWFDGRDVLPKHVLARRNEIRVVRSTTTDGNMIDNQVRLEEPHK